MIDRYYRYNIICIDTKQLKRKTVFKIAIGLSNPGMETFSTLQGGSYNQADDI